MRIGRCSRTDAFYGYLDFVSKDFDNKHIEVSHILKYQNNSSLRVESKIFPFEDTCNYGKTMNFVLERVFISNYLIHAHNTFCIILRGQCL